MYLIHTYVYNFSFDTFSVDNKHVLPRVVYLFVVFTCKEAVIYEHNRRWKAGLMIGKLKKKNSIVGLRAR